MNPDLVKVLLFILGVLLVIIGGVSINALCQPDPYHKKITAFFLAVVAVFLAIQVNQVWEVFKDFEASVRANNIYTNPNNINALVIGGCVYSVIALVILSKAWDGKPQQDDRTTLLEFVRKEIRNRLHSMDMEHRQAPVVARYVDRKVSQIPEFWFQGKKQNLPPDKSMAEVFNDYTDKKLLILGAPGSGKTTALLTLASQLRDEAEKDKSKPIPIILELSSWQPPEKIPDWIAMQLKAKYLLSVATCHDFLKAGEFILLFDGLDELKDQQEQCIQAINEFRSIRGYAAQQLVVCSRIGDYTQASEAGQELNIEAEYLLLPLSDEEIEDYLTYPKTQPQKPSPLWEAIEQDPDGFLELARQPLLLGLMRKTYEVKTGESVQLPIETNITEADKTQYRERCQENLLRDYVAHQLSETHDNKGYSRQQTEHYLRWLAKNLKRQTTTEFLLENMQPSWLEAKQRFWYRLVTGLTVGLTVGLSFGLTVGLIYGLIAGLTVGLSGGLDKIDTYEVLNLNLSAINIKRFLEGLIEGLIKGPILGLILGLIFSLSAGLIGESIFGLIVDLIYGLIAGLILGLIAGLILGLTIGLILGLQGNLRLKEKPNQGIWSSGRNAIILTGLSLPFTFAFFVLFYLTANQSINWSDMAIKSLGTSFLLLGISLGGGAAFIQHFVLRFFLGLGGQIPRDYVGFLQYAQERDLVLQNGGSFRFYHDLLREYLAGG